MNEFDKQLVIEEAERILVENSLGFHDDYPIRVSSARMDGARHWLAQGLRQKAQGKTLQGMGSDDFLEFSVLEKFHSACVGAINTNSPTAKIILNYREVRAIGELFLADNMPKDTSELFLMILDRFVEAGGRDNPDLKAKAKERISSQ